MASSDHEIDPFQVRAHRPSSGRGRFDSEAGADLRPRLHHVGYVVASMPGGIRRFCDSGGSLVVGPTEDPLLGVVCALIRLPEGVDIELVAPLPGAESPITSRLNRGGGLDHLCFWVDDVEASLARELAADAVLLVPPTYAVTFDSTVAFVHRRSGLVVELMGSRPGVRSSPQRDLAST